MEGSGSVQIMTDPDPGGPINIRIPNRITLPSSKCLSIPRPLQHRGRSHSCQRVQADRRGRRQGAQPGRDLSLPQAAGWGVDGKSLTQCVADPGHSGVDPDTVPRIHGSD
jgi:hypothetical protein